MQSNKAIVTVVTIIKDVGDAVVVGTSKVVLPEMERVY
jgi:hypothetical protein